MIPFNSGGTLRIVASSGLPGAAASGSRRDPELSAGGGRLEAAIRKVPPDLEGIKFGDRWGVIFSQYDLSCALEKRDSLECLGYTREDAARIGLNVVLYSLQQ